MTALFAVATRGGGVVSGASCARSFINQCDRELETPIFSRADFP